MRSAYSNVSIVLSYLMALCKCGCGKHTKIPSHDYIKGHWKAQQKKNAHGTNMGYRFGCRCDACQQARLEYGQNNNLLRRYGVTRQFVLDLFQKQAGRCAICKEPIEDYFTKKKSTHLDHDHVTGRVRGILCNKCNFGLGIFRDSPELLRAAANYIEKNLECTSDVNRGTMVDTATMEEKCLTK